MFSSSVAFKLKRVSSLLIHSPTCRTVIPPKGNGEGGERKLEPRSEGGCAAASKRKYASVAEWRRATSVLIAGLPSFRTCNSC